MDKKKTLKELLEETLSEDNTPKCDGDCRNCEGDKEFDKLLEALEEFGIAQRAEKITKEWLKDEKTPKMEIKIYANGAEVTYSPDTTFEHKALAAKIAISSILSSIKNKEIREDILTWACQETETFLD